MPTDSTVSGKRFLAREDPNQVGSDRQGESGVTVEDERGEIEVEVIAPVLGVREVDEMANDSASRRLRMVVRKRSKPSWTHWPNNQGNSSCSFFEAIQVLLSRGPSGPRLQSTNREIPCSS